MKYKELTTKPEAEVRRMLEDLRTEAYELAMKMRLNQTKDTQKLKAIKKDIARVMTFLSK